MGKRERWGNDVGIEEFVGITGGALDRDGVYEGYGVEEFVYIEEFVGVIDAINKLHVSIQE